MDCKISIVQEAISPLTKVVLLERADVTPPRSGGGSTNCIVLLCGMHRWSKAIVYSSTKSPAHSVKDKEYHSACRSSIFTLLQLRICGGGDVALVAMMEWKVMSLSVHTKDDLAPLCRRCSLRKLSFHQYIVQMYAK